MIASEQRKEHASIKISAKVFYANMLQRNEIKSRDWLTDDNEATVVPGILKTTFSYGTTETRRRETLGEAGKNRVKPLHFLTRGRVGGVRSKKNSYSRAKIFPI